MPKDVPKNISAKDRERFWSKAKKGAPDECWEWQGASDQRGYGQFWLGGSHHRAPRIALALDGRAPSGDMLACHHCDNPPCVNPDHLFVGSMSDNIRDAVAKGRFNFAAMHSVNANRDKTHCIRGHSLSGDNIIRQKGGRKCRKCQNMHQRAYDRKRRARQALEDTSHD